MNPNSKVPSPPTPTVCAARFNSALVGWVQGERCIRTRRHTSTWFDDATGGTPPYTSVEGEGVVRTIPFSRSAPFSSRCRTGIFSEVRESQDGVGTVPVETVSYTGTATGLPPSPSRRMTKRGEL